MANLHILRKKWFIPLVLTVVILLGSSFYMTIQRSNANSLNEIEIFEQLEQMYGGEVQSLQLNGDVYKADLERNGALYVLEIDAQTGKIFSLIQTKEVTEEAEKPVEQPPSQVKKPNVENPSNNPAVDSKPSPPQETKPSSVLLTEEQAANIALKALNKGTIAEVDDIDFVKTTEGGYYLIQIDLDTDAELDEVTYQVHAISGEILSVTWDD